MDIEDCGVQKDSDMEYKIGNAGVDV
jgi:hypothetical protein